jgi:hypothetical protein
MMIDDRTKHTAINSELVKSNVRYQQQVAALQKKEATAAQENLELKMRVRELQASHTSPPPTHTHIQFAVAPSYNTSLCYQASRQTLHSVNRRLTTSRREQQQQQQDHTPTDAQGETPNRGLIISPYANESQAGPKRKPAEKGKRRSYTKFAQASARTSQLRGKKAKRTRGQITLPAILEDPETAKPLEMDSTSEEESPDPLAKKRRTSRNVSQEKVPQELASENVEENDDSSDATSDGGRKTRRKRVNYAEPNLTAKLRAGDDGGNLGLKR